MNRIVLIRCRLCDQDLGYYFNLYNDQEYTYECQKCGGLNKIEKTRDQ